MQKEYAIIRFMTLAEQEHNNIPSKYTTEVFEIPVVTYLGIRNENGEVVIAPISKEDIIKKYKTVNKFLKQTETDMPKLFKHEIVVTTDNSIGETCFLSNNTEELNTSILVYKDSFNNVLDYFETDEVYVAPIMRHAVIVINEKIDDETTEVCRKAINEILNNEDITKDDIVTTKLFCYRKDEGKVRELE